MSMISVENLNVWFGNGRDRVDAVKGATFAVKRGDSFGLWVKVGRVSRRFCGR